MADEKDTKDEPAARKGAAKTPGREMDVDMIRTRIAQVLWFLCALFALVLAVGALTYALKANTDNGLVEFVRDAANALDLGIFSMDNGIKQFEGDSAETKNALFNWGLGAVFWLIVGRLADKFIRP
ncbi:hypothetical protein BJ980_003556 [Nocardioides daedukensis]|uniref:Uncharacterized protein n=1 Tax=Nocardioides daedukensis TaxID=634462 RepID=A0A7Y9S636_9ACTN|nr:hypothetical protein [Nocardioides daedukensis]